MTREYRGVLIHRNTDPHKLRWWAFTSRGMVSADTLAGIKECIRESLNINSETTS